MPACDAPEAREGGEDDGEADQHPEEPDHALLETAESWTPGHVIPPETRAL